jgi:hypothetical protein
MFELDPNIFRNFRLFISVTTKITKISEISLTRRYIGWVPTQDRSRRLLSICLSCGVAIMFGAADHHPVSWRSCYNSVLPKCRNKQLMSKNQCVQVERFIFIRRNNCTALHLHDLSHHTNMTTKSLVTS